MIRIYRRRSTAPDTLVDRGTADLPRVAGLVAQGMLCSDEIDKEIYGCVEVKEVLWQTQHHKCCFCEQEFERKFSTVEHFRPKARADRGGGVIHGGYWWLAYDFENLYFACQNCNQAKGDYFPLAHGSAPLAPGQHPRTHPESQMIVDPGCEEPTQHLTFVWVTERGFQIAALDARGRETIVAAELDREDLTKLRMKYYERILAPVITRFKRARREGDERTMREQVRQARRLAADDAPFALLARIALRRGGLL